MTPVDARALRELVSSLERMLVERHDTDPLHAVAVPDAHIQPQVRATRL